MEKYNFKFEKILQIKQDIENQIKQKYAFELQKKASLENENHYLKNSFIKDIEESLKNKRIGDKLSYSDLYFENSFNLAIDIRVEANQIKIREIDNNLLKIKEELIKATVEKKMFEKLKEKSIINYRKKKNKFEIYQNDEIANNKFKTM